MNSGEAKESSAAAAAAAVGGRTARACEGCLRRRARWFCVADDAFLCQACDTAVHSANPLARRHHRLPLRLRPLPLADLKPAWFTRKARTPRAARRLVPELLDSSSADDDDDDQLLYRVPIFDPALSEFCSPPPPPPSCDAAEDAAAASSLTLNITTTADDCLAGFGTSDAELTEFAADMESLLGNGGGETSLCLETLGLSGGSGGENSGLSVKAEMDDDDGRNGSACGVELETDAEMVGVNFVCGSPMGIEEGDDEKAAPSTEQRSWLRLDYEAIIASWGSSPWTDGERPQFKLGDCWPDYTGMWMIGGGCRGGGHGEDVGPGRLGTDGGREARVSRYREKRRTRLFSKKIRYEVRKLNAEKRPRMKGRFVKRACFADAAAGAVCLS
ncbi:Zinc finger protein CONSTANS-LIKE 16 [Ananas comosus]|nr:Zinc finger protein CONSTANS-LIKE 16 [Ananas comosus]